MDGERELTTGLLSKEARFRLIVSGPVGAREIERLIRKLELDKEILASEYAAAEQERDESVRQHQQTLEHNRSLLTERDAALEALYGPVAAKERP